MNQQQAIEFVKWMLSRPHFVCEDGWYSCPLSGGYYGPDWNLDCDCGKTERDIKLQELLDYLQGSQGIDFSQYFEFWVEE